MDSSHIFPFLFIFSTLSIAESCSINKCVNGGFPIRFPFQISNQEPARCGYPGFNLSCNKAGMATLNIPSFGDFLVRQINYVNQQIQLYDPNGCLPRKLLQGFKFNFSNSPFMPILSQNFTFLSCPSQLAISRYPIISCLSNSTTSVLATPSKSFAKSLPTSCNIITTLPLPVSAPVEPGDFSAELNGDLMLTWNRPDCYICESEGRVCGYKENTGLEIACFNNPTSGAYNGLKVLQVICLVIVLPSLICVIACGCFLCFVNWGYRLPNAATRRNQIQQQINSGSEFEGQSPIHFNGLDEPTIQSYEKVILGESRRLPGLNGTICSICLGEYAAEDTVRCIPDCKHCFHVDCIDQWLRVNSSCPLCRNSPSPSPSHTTQIA